VITYDSMLPDKIRRVPARVLSRVDGEFTMYLWRDVFVVAWEGPASVAGVRNFARTLSAQGTAQELFSLVHLLQGRTGLPKADVRAEFERLSLGLAQRVGCSVILDHRQGFIAGAVKAVLTGVSLIARVPIDLKLFSELEQLLSWLSVKHLARTGDRLEIDELREVIQAVDEAHPRTA
jgi:hypothetical protein